MSKYKNNSRPKKSRYANTFLLILEGEKTETIYFTQLKRRKIRNSGISIAIYPYGSSDVSGMVDMAKKKIQQSRGRNRVNVSTIDKAFIVIDRDHYANSNGTGIGLCHIQNAIQRIGDFPIEISISAPSFEYWYFLHFSDKMPSNNNDVIPLLERFLKENDMIHKDATYSKKGKEVASMVEKLLNSGKLVDAMKNAISVDARHNKNINDRLNRDPVSEIHSLITEMELNVL